MAEGTRAEPALDRAMMEAVRHLRDRPGRLAPALFALVPTRLLAGRVPAADAGPGASPLTLVEQEPLPAATADSPAELARRLCCISWPDQVAGAILAQDIRMRAPGTSGADDGEVRRARLFSGVLRSGASRDLLELQDDAGAPELRGGVELAPEVLAALRVGFAPD